MIDHIIDNIKRDKYGIYVEYLLYFKTKTDTLMFHTYVVFGGFNYIMSDRYIKIYYKSEVIFFC